MISAKASYCRPMQRLSIAAAMISNAEALVSIVYNAVDKHSFGLRIAWLG